MNVWLEGELQVWINIVIIQGFLGLCAFRESDIWESMQLVRKYKNEPLFVYMYIYIIIYINFIYTGICFVSNYRK